MSQPIQGLSPPLSFYQGSLQQQAYAAMPPSSSDSGNGDVIALGVGSIVALTLLGGGAFLASKQFGTSSAKKAESPQIPPALVSKAPTPTPDEESQPAQTEPASTKERPSHRPAQRAPQEQSQRHTNDLTAWFIDGFDVYREEQEGLFCGKHAVNTILHACKKRPVTKAEYLKNIVDKEGASSILELRRILERHNLRTGLAMLEYQDGNDAVIAELYDKGIEHCRGMLIPVPDSKVLEHHTAMVLGNDGWWHVSNSQRQHAEEKHFGTAYDALCKYQHTNNFVAKEVLIAH